MRLRGLPSSRNYLKKCYSKHMKSVEEILKRNARVELDKAWETSKTRRALIATITYAIGSFFMYRIGVSEPMVNALVPTGGYLLSTLSLPLVKNWWIKKYTLTNRDQSEEVEG